MPNTTGYNGNTDFLKWYKGIYGTDFDKNTGLVRKEGMSDGDWDVGSILYNYYIKSQQNETDRNENAGRINQDYDTQIGTVKAGYDSARGTLAQNKNTAQQNASIVYDKLKKYLPMKQKAQGLGGLGTQSAGLEAYNTYMGQLGGIDSDYQGGMRAIDEKETAHIGELEKYRSDSLADNDELYDSLARSYGDTADADARAAMDRYLQGEETRRGETFDLVKGALSSSTSSDVNELLNYLAGYEGKVSPEQYGVLRAYAESIAAANAKKASDEQTSKQQSEYGNNFNMAINVLSSSPSADVNELMAYVNGLEGKVSAEQLAALRQMATNVAATNTTNKNASDQANAKALADTVVSELIDLGSYDQAREYIEKNRTLLGDTTADTFLGIIEASIAQDAKIEAEEEQVKTEEAVIAGNVPIIYNGNEYKLGEKLDYTAREIAGNARFKSQLTAAGFSDARDDKIPDGTTFYIGNNKYVTYYNGDWYRSEFLGDDRNMFEKSYDYRMEKTVDNMGPLLNYFTGAGKSGNGGAGNSGGSSSSSVASNPTVQEYINATSQPMEPTAQAGQMIGSWIANYLKGLFKKK